MFVDRREELALLGKLLGSGKFEFFILYGRRRIGKTALVLDAIKGKPHIYYLATEKDNIRKFMELCAGKFPEILDRRADWEVILEFLKGRAGILVLDEFQNLIGEDKSVLSVFQKSIDETLSKSDMKVIILGSSVSILDSRVLSYKSPLYGRKTGALKLKAVDFFETAAFSPKAGIEELVEIYGFAGGVPYYHIKIDRPFWEWLAEEVKKADSFLKSEAFFIMKYEFSDAGTYDLVLQAIAKGKTKTGEIKDFAGLRRTDISPYLQKLISTDFIFRETPLTERQNSRDSRYFLNDQFLSFWYRFIYPNLSGIEERIFDAGEIKREYGAYLGFVFERICRQFVLHRIRAGRMDYTKVGRQWGKIPREFGPAQGREQYEIDIMAVNSGTKGALFAECKWQEKVDAERVAEGLDKKGAYVAWHNSERKETLAVFAKSFSRRIGEFAGKQVLCFDLKDLEREMR